jgi:predicted nicotinamide N-methyase
MTEVDSVSCGLPRTLEDLVLESLQLFNCWNAEAVPRAIKLYRTARPDLQARIAKQCDLWAFVWTSSSVRADIIITLCSAPGSKPETFQVVELGAGSGLSSIAALACGASVVATDLVMDALWLVQFNAVQNECAEKLRTLKFDWNESSAALQHELSEMAAPALRLIIGADILFLGSNIRPIARTLRALLYAHPHTLALIVDPGRTTREEFEGVLPEYDLHLAARVDAEYLVTQIACMKVCTVFVIACKSDTPLTEACSAPVIECAKKVLERCSPPGLSTVCGYTFPPVMPRT